ncbi:MAG: phenylalanine--tRNA ligase subunit beta, partial [Acidobacteria bacterium]|nr:phenylalanine--tRNA ligase subunit beta [Acidobacteriota bacterium]
ELGQPLHAFDHARVAGPRIQVRRAAAGERLTTLDGVERKLTPEMLVVADAEVPSGLAGIMGGLASEVTAETRDVLLEGAFWEPTTIRRTSSALGMHTDASHRFERGADPELCARAVTRAAALLAELTDGEVLHGCIDVYPRPFAHPVIDLDHRRLCAFVGVDIAAERVETWLRGLGFELETGGEGSWRVTVPSWRRRDVELVADLYEEVVRLHGYDDIPATLPALAGADGHTTAAHRRATAHRRHLAACGYSEAITFAFHDAEGDRLFPGLQQGAGLELGNALSERYRVMRRSLLPNLIDAARFNQRRGAPAVRLFELGHVFAAGSGGGPDEVVPGVRETETLALVAGGTVGSPWDRSRELDLFDLKGVLESLAAASSVELEARPGDHPALAGGATAELFAGDRPVGYLGRLQGADEPYPLYVAELLTDALAGRVDLSVSAPSRFPGVAADLTLTHALDVSWADIAAAVEAAAPDQLAGFSLKDRYRGKGVPEGAVNTTISFLYSSPSGTLTQEEVNERQGALARELERRFGWKG